MFKALSVILLVMLVAPAGCGQPQVVEIIPISTILPASTSEPTVEFIQQPTQEPPTTLPPIPAITPTITPQNEDKITEDEFTDYLKNLAFQIRPFGIGDNPADSTCGNEELKKLELNVNFKSTIANGSMQIQIKENKDIEIIIEVSSGKIDVVLNPTESLFLSITNNGSVEFTNCEGTLFFYHSIPDPENEVQGA